MTTARTGSKESASSSSQFFQAEETKQSINEVKDSIANLKYSSIDALIDSMAFPKDSSDYTVYNKDKNLADFASRKHSKDIAGFPVWEGGRTDHSAWYDACCSRALSWATGVQHFSINDGELGLLERGDGSKVLLSRGDHYISDRKAKLIGQANINTNDSFSYPHGDMWIIRVKLGEIIAASVNDNNNIPHFHVFKPGTTVIRTSHLACWGTKNPYSLRVELGGGHEILNISEGKAVILGSNTGGGFKVLTGPGIYKIGPEQKVILTDPNKTNAMLSIKLEEKIYSIKCTTLDGVEVEAKARYIYQLKDHDKAVNAKGPKHIFGGIDSGNEILPLVDRVMIETYQRIVSLYPASRLDQIPKDLLNRSGEENFDEISSQNRGPRSVTDPKLDALGVALREQAYLIMQEEVVKLRELGFTINVVGLKGVPSNEELLIAKQDKAKNEYDFEIELEDKKQDAQNQQRLKMVEENAKIQQASNEIEFKKKRRAQDLEREAEEKESHQVKMINLENTHKREQAEKDKTHEIFLDATKNDAQRTQAMQEKQAEFARTALENKERQSLAMWKKQEEEALKRRAEEAALEVQKRDAKNALDLKKAIDEAKANTALDAEKIKEVTRQSNHALAKAKAELTTQEELRNILEQTKEAKLGQKKLEADLSQEIEKVQELAKLRKQAEIDKATLESKSIHAIEVRKQEEAKKVADDKFLFDQQIEKLNSDEKIRQEKEKTRLAEEKTLHDKEQAKLDLMKLTAMSEQDRELLKAQNAAKIKEVENNAKLAEAKNQAELKALELGNIKLEAEIQVLPKKVEYEAITGALGNDTAKIADYLRQKLETEAKINAPPLPAQPANLAVVLSEDGGVSGLNKFFKAAATQSVSPIQSNVDDKKKVFSRQ